jgi:hypothetical protein
MNEIVINPEKRKELTNWLMEQPAKFANPILQFLQENEVKKEEEKKPTK